jgi:hypothetical protein
VLYVTLPPWRRYRTGQRVVGLASNPPGRRCRTLTMWPTAGESIVRSRARVVGARRWVGFASTAMIRAPSSAGSPIVGTGVGVGVGVLVGDGAAVGVACGQERPPR